MTVIEGLQPGSRVVAAGLPIVVEGETGLALAPEHAQTAPYDSPWTVRATWPDSPELTLRPDELLKVHGIWDGSGIAVSRVTVTRKERKPRQQRAPAGRPIEPSRYALLRKALDALTAADLLAAVHTTSRSDLVGSLCVFDARTAQRVLRAEGISVTQFRIVRCRWTRTDLGTARGLYAHVPDELLSAFGEAVTEQVQPQVLLEVKLVTLDLARAVSDLPTGLVKVTPYIRPDA
jgi:hypothetical protein